MLTQSLIREAWRRRVRAMLVSPVIMIAVMTLWCTRTCDPLIELIATCLGTAQDRAATALFASMCGVAVWPFARLGWHEARNSIRCPACDADVMGGLDRLLATRCCPQCDGHVVEGRPRSLAAHVRLTEYRCRNHILLALWVITALGVVMSVTGLHGEPMTPAIGAGIAGWLLVRSRDRRFIAPLAVSVVLLGESAVHLACTLGA